MRRCIKRRRPRARELRRTHIHIAFIEAVLSDEPRCAFRLQTRQTRSTAQQIQGIEIGGGTAHREFSASVPVPLNAVDGDVRIARVGSLKGAWRISGVRGRPRCDKSGERIRTARTTNEQHALSRQAPHGVFSNCGSAEEKSSVTPAFFT